MKSAPLLASLVVLGVSACSSGSGWPEAKVVDDAAVSICQERGFTSPADNASCALGFRLGYVAQQQAYADGTNVPVEAATTGWEGRKVEQQGFIEGVTWAIQNQPDN